MDMKICTCFISLLGYLFVQRFDPWRCFNGYDEFLEQKCIFRGNQNHFWFKILIFHFACVFQLEKCLFTSHVNYKNINSKSNHRSIDMYKMRIKLLKVVIEVFIDFRK